MADSDKDTKKSHHAYLIVGNKEDNIHDIQNFVISEFGVNIKANVDYFEIDKENFGIGDSRELTVLASSKPVSDSFKKIFVIFTEKMTIESQNSLLKTFEEPNQGIHFILVLRNENILLPTLRSRLNLVSLKQKESGLKDKVVFSSSQNFLKLKVPERIVLVKKMIDDLDKDKIKVSEIHSFVLGMIRVCEQKIREDFKNKNAVSALETLTKMNSYLYDRSASYKMIFEHIALTLPVIL